MSFSKLSILLLVTLAAVNTCEAKLKTEYQSSITCPPPGLDAKQGLDVASYISKRWYSVKQNPVAYQREAIFFCTSAEYTLLDGKSNWCQFFRLGCGKEQARIKVFNRATVGVNGAEETAELQGVVPDLDVASKLLVGPTFLPNFAFGPYWVMEAGTYKDLLNGRTKFEGTNYEWALISGGPPKQATDKGCTPGSGARNFNGLWIFTRDPVPPVGVIDAVESLAIAKGYDTSAMLPVVQEGCIYK